jgi:hypothetical protein
MNKDEPPHPSLGDEVQVGDRVRVEWVGNDGTCRTEGTGVLLKYDIGKSGNVSIEYRDGDVSCSCMMYGKTWAGHRELRKLESP